MGYILPVQYTQYQEYHNRIKSVKSRYSQSVRIDKLKQVYLSQFEASRIKNVPAKTKLNKQPKKGVEKIYAEITGIGRNFNAGV